MMILQGGRQSYKTAELIKQAHATGAGIVLPTKMMCDVAKEQAIQMNCKDVVFFSFGEILNGEHRKYRLIKKLYIDELPMLMQHICGMEVALATGDIECFPLKGISHE